MLKMFHCRYCRSSHAFSVVQNSPIINTSRNLSLSPASVDVVVVVPGGALAVALGTPAAAVGLVPHLVRALEQARRLGSAVHALAAAQVLVEVLKQRSGVCADRDCLQSSLL